MACPSVQDLSLEISLILHISFWVKTQSSQEAAKEDLMDSKLIRESVIFAILLFVWTALVLAIGPK
jgi:hypothetical protein